MENNRLEHEEIARCEIDDNVDLIISATKRGNANLGYTIVQQINAGGHKAFLKGTTIRVDSPKKLLKIRDIINIALQESEEY